MNSKIDLKNIKINDEFWSYRQKLITDVVIPYQEKILNDEIPNVEKSHALANFRIAAGMEDGEFYGMVFQDSDVAKWLEGVAFSLLVKPDAQLEKRADKIIEIIQKAQEADGYLDTYFTVKEPEHKWKNLLEGHELYCAGHMMEAGAAYYEATGKDKLLKVTEKLADHIDSIFGCDKYRGVPGHQEIEIGLMRLFHTTGKEKYKQLAQYFIDERGKDPDFFKKESEKRDWTYFDMDPDDTKYNQSFAPVREQSTAEGHSVRAVYMYTAMADIAAETGDQELIKACDRLWDNIVQKRMYITGGIGSTAEGEAFTTDYDLPNDTIYAETCASIGLMFFARKMIDIRPMGEYGDIMEQALYNGVISGMQLDGKRFFYVNPLEVNVGISEKVLGYKHVVTQRPGWYKCACCPPNVVRLLMSLGQYAWGESDDVVYSHLFMGGKVDLNNCEIDVESNYPWKGDIRYNISPKSSNEFTLAIRIPSYVKNAKIYVNNEIIDQNGLVTDGYLYIKRAWSNNDQVHVTFDMSVRRVYANTAVRNDAGCVCLMRGPFVYCFEGIDNGALLQQLRIPNDAKITESVYDGSDLDGLTVLNIAGERKISSEKLYSEQPPVNVPTEIIAIPYFAWGNRGENNMRVWMLES